MARFGRLHILETVASTNAHALSLAAGREPLVVVASRQTAGRGRFGRHWYSDEESLTFSLLVFADPEAPCSLPQTTHVAALAVCLAIESITNLEPLVRWPNDIILNGKKVSGILCEQRKDAVAVGVGVNVGQTEFPENLPEAISLRMAKDLQWDRLSLLENVLENFFSGRKRIQNGEWPQILTEVKDRSAVLHRRVEVKTLLRRHVGTVVDIDSEGRIVLRKANGSYATFSSGEVRRLA